MLDLNRARFSLTLRSCQAGTVLSVQLHSLEPVQTGGLVQGLVLKVVSGSPVWVILACHDSSLEQSEAGLMGSARVMAQRAALGPGILDLLL